MPNNDQNLRFSRDNPTGKTDSGSQSPATANTGQSGLEIIDSDELQTILDDNRNSTPAAEPSSAAPDSPEADIGSDLDELSLVSTQALQKMLVGKEKKPEPKKAVENMGFNPYDKNDAVDDTEENQ